MKLTVIFSLTLLGWLGSSRPALAQAATTNEAAFAGVISKINADISAGRHTAAELADDLRQFDAVLAAEHGNRNDFAANILVQKGIVYMEILNDPNQAIACFREIKTNYSNTKFAAKIDQILEAANHKVEIKKIRDALANGALLPGFSGTNLLTGTPLSVAQYQGKVLLIDFWATWCMPCRMAMPGVIAAYEKYHPQGLEMIGVTLDDDQDKVLDFVKDSKMPWPQYFEGHGWENTLTAKYGIDGIPATILLDGGGRIIARDLRGEELDQAIARALAAQPGNLKQ